MWSWLLLSVALAAPPAGLNLDESAPWEQGAQSLLSGPPGCWEVVGKARWDYIFSRFGETRGEALFVSRLEDGIWTRFNVIPLGELAKRGSRSDLKRRYSDKQRFAPLMGKIKPEERQSRRRKNKDEEEATDPINLFQRALDEIDTDVEYAWATWSEDRKGVVLVRSVPVGRGEKTADIEVFFPNGGTLPASLDVTFPQPFYTRGMPSARVNKAVVRMRARDIEGTMFPSVEASQYDVRVLGMTFQGRQTIEYRHVHPCTPSNSEDPD